MRGLILGCYLSYVSLVFLVKCGENKRLDEPVLVKVAGMRVIKQIKTNRPDCYVAVWAGAQSQKLTSQTSGNIAFDEALGITEEDKENLDNHWDNILNDEVVVKQSPITGNDLYWSDLTSLEQGFVEPVQLVTQQFHYFIQFFVSHDF